MSMGFGHEDAAISRDIEHLIGNKNTFELTIEIIAYRSLLSMVLSWRGLDGDGISDPLRKDIADTLKKYKDK